MNDRAARRRDPAAPRWARGARARRVVRWGSHALTIGGDAPVRVQSMTNTDTVDVIGTAIQVKELAQAGSELVRITVNTPEAAEAVPHIREQLDRMGIDVPLIGDFHYNGHRLLSDYPAMAAGAEQVPHQPGQRRQGRQARPPVRADDRGGDAPRQGGAHRRQLGQPRPGTAGRADGRERRARRALGRQAGDVPGAGASRR